MSAIHPQTEDAPPAEGTKSPSSAQVVSMLQSIDWDQYWESVTEKSYKEIEAYRRARAKYLETASQHVFV